MPAAQLDPRELAVSREHRRAKTDRLDTELLKRGRPKHLREHRIGPVADSGPFPASDRLCRRRGSVSPT